MWKRLVVFTLLSLVSAAPAQAEDVSTAAITRLIQAAEPGRKDANGWAVDLSVALQSNDLPVTRENACAAIAVIDQESSFVANPAVPGLGRLSEKALRGKLAGYPVIGAKAAEWLDTNPSPGPTFMSLIRAAKTERDLDLTYRGMVAAVSAESGLGTLINAGLVNGFIEERNEVTTIGSMQVSVAYALKEERRNRILPMSLADVYAVRDSLYTRPGGLHYGVGQLLGFETGYDRKIFRFADYNAGRYASRNASLQKVVSDLTGAKLAFDGDFLSYGKDGKASSSVTDSEKAVRKAVEKAKLTLSKEQIRSDLLKEKSPDFTSTRIFTALRAAWQAKTGKPPAFAMIPEITLKSAKISHTMTTRDFAERVTRRYNACMAVK